jgi:hypothetical protein
MIVHVRCHRVVSKYVTERNKTEIQVGDIEKAVVTVVKNDKKLR